jgi:hypothetical protein
VKRIDDVILAGNEPPPANELRLRFSLASGLAIDGEMWRTYYEDVWSSDDKIDLHEWIRAVESQRVPAPVAPTCVCAILGGETIAKGRVAP